MTLCDKEDSSLSLSLVCDHGICGSGTDQQSTLANGDDQDSQELHGARISPSTLRIVVLHINFRKPLGLYRTFFRVLVLVFALSLSSTPQGHEIQCF